MTRGGRSARSGSTTEIKPAGEFYFAEDYHQQYLQQNPYGYCNHGFCQAAYPSTATGITAN